MTAKRIVVLGDVTLDLLVQLPSSLDKINRGSDTETQFDPRPGGSAANSAIWFSRLGHHATLISKVGDDFFGKLVTANLLEEGVRISISVDSDHPTGVLVALIEPDGERSFLIKPGANYFLRPDEIENELYENADLFLLSGYSLYRESSREASIAAIKTAQNVGVKIAVDPASAGLLAEFGVERFLEITAGIDILLANREEAQLLCGTDGDSEWQTLISALSKSFELVGLKLGEDGSAAVQRGAQMVHIGALTVEIIDTTGCGDAWNSAFLSSHLSGQDLAICLREGAKLAARVLQQVGATPK